MYAVIIETSQGPQVSRFFATIKAARKWATYCKKFSSVRILRGGPGGEPVE